MLGIAILKAHAKLSPCIFSKAKERTRFSQHIDLRIVNRIDPNRMHLLHFSFKSIVLIVLLVSILQVVLTISYGKKVITESARSLLSVEI